MGGGQTGRAPGQHDLGSLGVLIHRIKERVMARVDN